MKRLRHLLALPDKLDLLRASRHVRRWEWSTGEQRSEAYGVLARVREATPGEQATQDEGWRRLRQQLLAAADEAENVQASGGGSEQ